MSRIFDALQRSGEERTGVKYPDMISVATEALEPRHEDSADQAGTERTALERATTERARAIAEFDPAALTEALEHGAATTSAEFPTLQVAVTAASRLVFFTEPDSLAAEKFRFLGVRLRQLAQTRPLKKVLVTSTLPEEGKSLVSANLAGVLGRRKQKVLLLEGDLRRPVLAQQFGLGRLAGLGEWLKGDRQAVSNIYRLEGPGFWLMPAGDPPDNPLELMQSGKLSRLMEHLATLFDWIIVDSPPLLPLADTTVWARMTDGALLVTREGKTEKGPLQRGLEILRKSDLLGVVLNGRTSGDTQNYYQRYSPTRVKKENKEREDRESKDKESKDQPTS
jgi:capsular exopolysaccharide synthesis family protein